MKINILLLFLISTAFVYSSERIQIPYSQSTDQLISTYRSGTSLLKYRKPQKSAFHLFLVKHRQQLIFTGIGLAAGVISGIFNKEAKSQYDKEKSLYEAYINASKDSDFNELWNEYKKAADKTDRYLNLRGIFGTSAGVIGVSLLISIVVEGNF